MLKYGLGKYILITMPQKGNTFTSLVLKFYNTNYIE